MKILTVHPYTLVRLGLKQLIEEEQRGVTFGEARTVDQALSEIERRQWDLVIIDRGYLNTALEGLQVLRRSWPLPPFVTIRGPEISTCPGCKVACGYCVPVDGDRKALLKALKGAAPLETCLEHAPYKMRPSSANQRVRLSTREQDVVLALAAGKRPGEIAAEWRLSTKTVSTYKIRAMSKLELRSMADLVRYAIGEHRT